MVSYADVYNLEDPMHAEPRRYTDDDGQFRWRYYEGYGRADCPEKRVFLTSVNDVHPLWSSETPERLSKKSYPLSQIGIGVHFAESLRETHIDETTGIDLLGQSRSLVDFSDRENRISWNFAKMLKIFADNTERENSSAFYENRGLKWAQKNDMMNRFSSLIDAASAKYDERGYLPLNDISVKYPHKTFKLFAEVFWKELATQTTDYNGEDSHTHLKTTVSKLNHNAAAFIPGRRGAWTEPSQGRRGASTEPSQGRRGAWTEASDRPCPPNGFPHTRRPMTTNRNSTQSTLWSQNKMKSDDILGRLNAMSNECY
jgi:hypothetical protein